MTATMNIIYSLTKKVSVPIRGLFNLTEIEKEKEQKTPTNRFPSPLGDYLI